MTDAPIDLDVATQRSPKYPYIALDKALERAAILYNHVRDTPQPREVMAKAYGKPATSSATIQTFATLAQYGLLETVPMAGQRRLRVTSLARSITHPNAPADVVAKGRKTAAMNPPVFKEIWDKFGSTDGLHDSALIYYLTQEREQTVGTVFTEKAAHEVLRTYRATLVFAELSDVDKQEGQTQRDSAPEADNIDPFDEMLGLSSQDKRLPPPPPPPPPPKGIEMAQGERELQSGMLSKGAGYRVIVSGQIGVKEIERLIRKLEMDKEILADEADDDLSDLRG